MSQFLAASAAACSANASPAISAAASSASILLSASGVISGGSQRGENPDRSAQQEFSRLVFPDGGFHSHKNSPELFGRDILRGIIIFKKGRSGMLEKTISTRH
jgi:hypothetical protein